MFPEAEINVRGNFCIYTYQRRVNHSHIKERTVSYIEIILLKVNINRHSKMDILKRRQKYKPRVWVTGESGGIMQSGVLGIRHAYAYYQGVYRQKKKNEATTY